MKKTIYLLLLTSLLLSQDEIIFKDGKILKGEVDRNSIVETTTSIRFKPKGWEVFAFYNIEQINFVRAWNGKLLFPIGVVANTKSDFYHLPNVKHLPSKVYQRKYINNKAAIEVGFLPCHACFDTHPQISDYALEKQLVKATILQIQDTNEIMYEHPLLPKLQKLMKQILDNWPEELKRYDYRIQIIRDDAPNAFAVAGGNLYFSTGLLQMIETDEELEAVLAHEIAHVERRHTLRAFKEYQKKQLTVAAITTFLAVAAIAVDSEEGLALAGLVSEIGKFAVEFTQIGFDRDLEQEADMFAQIYLNERGKDIHYMLITLDKLATHSKTRVGYVPQANAFSSHPDLLARINQIENGFFHQYDEPLTMQLHPIKPDLDINPGFIEMIISHAYKTKSSDSQDKDQILLLGKIINNHEELSFQVNSITLNFLGSLGQTQLGGIVEVTVPFEGSTEFVGRIKAPKELSEEAARSVFNKNILPFAVDISAIVLRSGENAKRIMGLQNIQCTMTIN